MNVVFVHVRVLIDQGCKERGFCRLADSHNSVLIFHITQHKLCVQFLIQAIGETTHTGGEAPIHATEHSFPNAVLIACSQERMLQLDGSERDRAGTARTVCCLRAHSARFMCAKADFTPGYLSDLPLR